MRRISWALLTFFALIALSQPAVARGYRSYSSRSYHSRSYSSRSYSSHSRSYSGHRSYSSRSSSSHKSVHGGGYHRKDGTYVHSYSRSSPGTATHTRRAYSSRSHTSYASGGRDSHGRIRRSAAAKNEFKRGRPCPSTGRSSGPCPGYVIDHVNPLACGGADAPGNMQWQTTAAAKAKDKTERIGCR